MVKISNLERVNMLMLYGVADGNARFERVPNPAIFEIMVSSSPRLMIMAVIGPKNTAS